ncbi:hypothetical protein BH10PAT3_BH10PAT3_4810 [soil metagenome]
MSAKFFEIESIGLVQINKRRGSKSIRLSFDSKGKVRVTIPVWVPYQAGVAFARERSAWISKHQPTVAGLFSHGAKIGKAHHMQLIADGTVRSIQVRLRGTDIVVKYPSSLLPESLGVQAAGERGAKKALLAEAEQLLPQRLKLLAKKHGFNYRSVSVKQLKTKWGSCNQNHDITLNYYLLQLPWNLIDYVLTHELVHTEHLNHSEAFWNRFESALPGAKKIRKELKTYKTSVIAT